MSSVGSAPSGSAPSGPTGSLVVPNDRRATSVTSGGSAASIVANAERAVVPVALRDLDDGSVDVDERDRVRRVHDRGHAVVETHGQRLVGAEVGNAVGSDDQAGVVVGGTGRLGAPVPGPVERETRRPFQERESGIDDLGVGWRRDHDLVAHLVEHGRDVGRADVADRVEEFVECAGPTGAQLVVGQHLRDRGRIFRVGARRVDFGNRVGELVGIRSEVGEVVDRPENALDAFVAARAVSGA